MSAKNVDRHNRFRSITVGFRVSPEEQEELNRAVALSGLPKQEYCYRKCMGREVVVQPNPRVALIMSGVLYFLPYFPMKLGGVLGEWMFIFPIWSAKAQWVLRTAEHKLVNLLPLSCEMPVWIVIFTLIFTVVSFLITCKSFSEYQGT